MIDISLIINELKALKNFKKDADLCRFLDIGTDTLFKCKQRNTFSKKIIEIISIKFPEVSKAYLLTGEGDMIKNKEHPYKIQETEHGVLAESHSNFTRSNESRTVEMSREVYDLLMSQQKTIQLKEEKELIREKSHQLLLEELRRLKENAPAENKPAAVG